MKVYLDIIVNHTADVIHFAECADGSSARTGASPIIRTRATAGCRAQPINRDSRDDGSGTISRSYGP